MKTPKELQDRLTKLEARLLELYTRQSESPSSTIDMRVLCTETKIDTLRWSLGLEVLN